MSRTRGQRAFRRVQRAMEKYHDGIVNRIYENPALLDEVRELGFNVDSTKILFKDKEPPPLIKGGRRVDLLFLYDFGDFYELVLIEEAVGPRHLKDHLDQLKHAYLDFKYHWKEWFKGMGGEIDLANKKVFLTTIPLNWDPLLTSIKEAVDTRHSKRKKLGKLILNKL